MEDRLKTLYELQLLLSEIDRIKFVRGELPHEVEDLANAIEGLNVRVQRYEGEIETLAAQRVAEINKIENKKMLIERYNEQLNNVRNSHEFDCLTKEIECENLDITLAEKNIREIEHTIDNRRADVANTEQQIADQNNILADKKNQLDTIISETRNEEEALHVKAKGLEPLVDERTLMAFKRIRQNARNGLGIVPVDRNSCGGCFNRIPPQKQIEIKTRKKVIICEYCGRIMIDPELAQQVSKA